MIADNSSEDAVSFSCQVWDHVKNKDAQSPVEV